MFKSAGFNFFFTIVIWMSSFGNLKSATGQTTIAKWKNNKQGAYTMMFDDSMISQADNAVPALVARGLVGTWLVNPGKSRYQSRKQVWEVTCPETGQELANHTMNHKGAQNYQEAEYEIGECARIIWSLRPSGASKLQAFHEGSGVRWDIRTQLLEEIKEKYHCISRYSNGSMATEYGENAETMIIYPQTALNTNEWIAVHFHGIGDEYLSIEHEDFLQLCDYLVTIQNHLWIAGYISIYQYQEERETAHLDILESSNNRIRLNLISEKDTSLFKEPLTLITEVPVHWDSVNVEQDGESTHYGIDGNGKVQYEAIPGRGEVVLTPVIQNLSVSDSDTAVPGGYELLQNYPNPFNDSTVIKYHLPEKLQVRLTIYNVFGQEMKTFSIESTAGLNSIFWDGRNNLGENVTSGIYFYQIKNGVSVLNKKMILMK